MSFVLWKITLNGGINDGQMMVTMVIRLWLNLSKQTQSRMKDKKNFQEKLSSFHNIRKSILHFLIYQQKYNHVLNPSHIDLIFFSFFFFSITKLEQAKSIAFSTVPEHIHNWTQWRKKDQLVFRVTQLSV